MTVKLKLAGIQMNCAAGELDDNLAKSKALIHEAMREKPDLICFPESVLDGYACSSSNLRDLARPLDGEESWEIAALARHYGVGIMWSLAELQADNIYNTAVFYDRNGSMQLVYRKSHLCREANEHLAYSEGLELPVTEFAGLTIGAMICFDRHFPEVCRSLRLQGAKLILHPTATDWFSPDPGSINTAMMRTRAYENRCFVFSVNATAYGGGSALFGPWGDVIAAAGDGEEILHTQLDLSLIAGMPDNHFELVSARRSEIYT